MQSSSKILKLLFFLFMISGLFFTSCKDDDDVIKTEFTGTKIAMGNGFVWSYVKTDEEGHPVTIGIQFDETALNNLPTGDPFGHEFKLQMPADIEVPPYQHITFDWNEHGHEPDGVYNLPHFDSHFYFITEAERAAINPADVTAVEKPLPAANMPPQYLDTNEAVPGMGVHLIDLLSPEIAGTGTFTKTFIYGKYDGEIVFLEPMFTLDYIKSKPEQSIPIRKPAHWMTDGYYPSAYSVRFNSAKKIYTVALEEMGHVHE